MSNLLNDAIFPFVSGGGADGGWVGGRAPGKKRNEEESVNRLISFDRCVPVLEIFGNQF